MIHQHAVSQINKRNMRSLYFLHTLWVVQKAMEKWRLGPLWDTFFRMLQEAWTGMGIERGSENPTIILVCMMAT